MINIPNNRFTLFTRDLEKVWWLVSVKVERFSYFRHSSPDQTHKSSLVRRSGHGCDRHWQCVGGLKSSGGVRVDWLVGCSRFRSGRWRRLISPVAPSLLEISSLFLISIFMFRFRVSGLGLDRTFDRPRTWQNEQTFVIDLDSRFWTGPDFLM